jgi:Leucine-rich repeat (LRR) protein
VQLKRSLKRLSPLALAAIALLIFRAIGCEDPKPTQSELDAMAALQRAHGHVQTDTDGHGSFIDFDRVEVRDVDLKPLADLPFVTRMKFDYAPIGDEGLVFFKNLQSLRELSLRGTKITDAGLVNLQNLASLTELDLERTGITNAGLEALGPIKSLRRVYVGPGGPTTAAGIDALKAQNPRVNISKK